MAAVRARLVPVLVAAALLAAAGGCGGEAPDPRERLAVCLTPTAERPAGKQVRIEFRTAGKMVAGGSIPVGNVFHAPIPAGADIEVYVDGSLVGDSGSAHVAGEALYLRGEGCPEIPDVDDDVE
ncbi:hypothetical protein GCM10010168_46670 [Actinoplanes ianthinogenes]|uniref:Lipoprotein n=1 Tax=Actinoplanes ianthinogenes TaxID=122358 RepID=A0ABM7LPA4_9ACTN|nr:hypothetical protein [Actinoplanes ianthinogenes]BCJ41034.1 hypothetical protein Aiant_16910 [Actinoplanes ianthinogenes]GGR23365.1 hypothetical protein GCM10010168_46670 [Actinoplanes ianthinogenes]